MKRLTCTAAVLLALVAAANEIVVTTAQQTAGAGVSTRAIVIERRSDAGALITSTADTVTVTSSSPTGEFNDLQTSNSGWTAPFSVGFSTGAAQRSFVYRDPTPGLHTLTFNTTGYVSTTHVVRADLIVVHSDFEGSLLTSESPPGPFHSLEVTTGNQLGRDAGAAHRGNFGLGVVDQNASTSNNTDGRLTLRVGRVTGDAFFRGWVKTSGPQSGTDITLFIVSSDLGSPLINANMNGSGRLILYIQDTAGATRSLGADAGLVPNQFQLMEAQLTGVGTADAGVALWLDSRRIAEISNVDLTGRALGPLYVGEAWATPMLWTGTVDWDDVALSKLVVPNYATTAPTQPVRAGDCVPFNTLLGSRSAAGPVAAAYDLNLTVATDAGSLHGTPDCSDNPGTSVTVVKSSNLGQFYLRPGAAGSAKVMSTTHPDFLGGTTNFFVILPALSGTDAGIDSGVLVDGGAADAGGDAGTPDGGGDLDAGIDAGLSTDAGERSVNPRELGVGCGCAHADALMLISALTLFARRRKSVART